MVPVFAVASIVAPQGSPSSRLRRPSTGISRAARRFSLFTVVWVVFVTIGLAGACIRWFAGAPRSPEKNPAVISSAPAVQASDEVTGAIKSAPNRELDTEQVAAKEVTVVESRAPEVISGIDAVAILLADRPSWPEFLSLSAPTRFPAIHNGRMVGQVMLPAGTSVEVVDINENEVEVQFRGAKQRLPHDATNLAALAAAASRTATEKLSLPEARTSPAVVDQTDKSSVQPRLVAAAGKIDALIAAHHAKNKVRKPPLISDERFSRRAYLTAIGRIPTAEEAEEFLTNKDPHKRANLVASLFKSPGYASHMSNWMFDRLRVVDYNNVVQIRHPHYRQWIRRSAEQDFPWDKMVTTLLTTSGGGWDEESAAIGYFTRDRGMPLDHLAVTMRVFLGSRMECAQCHNDPFGDTKQKDFLRLAAFTQGLEPMKQNLFYAIFQEMNAMPQTSTEHRAAWMLWRDIYGSSLSGGGTGRIVLPLDYKYKDARPGDIEGARAPFGKATSLASTRDRDDGREKLAKWITQGTGERFPGMIANSMWRRVMGAGYFEPCDEYLEPPDTHDPAISAHLAALITELQYSLRDFQQTLMLTEAFQYESNPSASVADGGADDFRGRRVQRMSAEQLWDSLVTLVSGNPDAQSQRQTDDRIFIEGAPVLEGQMTMAQLSREVMAIENEKELRRYFTDFVEKVKADRGEQSGGDGAATAMRSDPVGFVRGTHPRAADLPSPAPRNHFVALFGQSSRNVVDGSTREPNMGQVLSLMNGFVQAELINKTDAQLTRDVDKASSVAEKIRQLYLGIFSREPSAEEVALMAEEFSASPSAAAANVASAMIMSAEFLYIQ